MGMGTGTDGIGRQKTAETPSKRADIITKLTGGDTWLPPWLFKHNDLIHTFETAFTVDEEELINTLNYIHFAQGQVLVLLGHPKYEESVLVRANPEPCPGKGFICRWEEGQLPGPEIGDYQYLNLIIDDGRSMILVPPILKQICADYLMIGIPEASYGLGQRQTRRYRCQEMVGAEVMQNGFLAQGELLDFSPAGLRVNVSLDPSCSFRWFNRDDTLSIRLKRGDQILFAGPCRYVWDRSTRQSREIVVSPINTEIKRFCRKRLRNYRQHLTPSPRLTFEHPLLGRHVQLDINDISSVGFSVYEEPDDRVLVPGMILPEVSIDFAGALKMKCTAQVIYSLYKEGKGFRSGIAVLDMDIDTYSRLCHILSSAQDSHTHVSKEVDLDALWEFFFHTGFLYPKKYRLIQSHYEDFKETHRRLYQEAPEISRHFTYQKGGRIYGHISMVRAYQRAWMIHHHAALALSNRRTGFVVLKQIMHYLHDMYRLPSAKIDYVMAYFRPENRFPAQVFGGFAKALNDPHGCSLDTFGYLPYTSLALDTALPGGWALEECGPRHLWELDGFYRNHSGGLLLDILNLAGEKGTEEPLDALYSRLGFHRGWTAYSLSQGAELCAVLIANKSDLGFNLSELLNCITVLVTNQEKLPWEVLSVAIQQLIKEYPMDKVPILFYPFGYVTARAIPCEKQYELWILDVNYGNKYMEYMQKRFRVV